MYREKRTTGRVRVNLSMFAATGEKRLTRKGERPIYHPRLLSVEMASANAIIHE